MIHPMLVAMLLTVALTACEKESAEAASGVSGSIIVIFSPKDGARLDANAQIMLEYDITLNGEGDHAHLYVDDRRIAMLRKNKGNYMIFPLEPGIREICIKVVNNNHVPIGVSRCVKVTVG